MTTPNEPNEIRVPESPPGVPSNLEEASLNQVLTRVLRNSWVQALREIEHEKSGAAQTKEIELRDLFFLFLRLLSRGSVLRKGRAGDDERNSRSRKRQ